MPTATNELREKIEGHFGCGIDLYAPLQFLKDNGWKDKAGILLAPDRRPITDKEWDCVDFLIQEWDFDFFAGEGAGTH